MSEMQKLPQRFIDRIVGAPPGAVLWVNDTELALILAAEERENDGRSEPA